jgi:glucose/arabinose dehydrogenase
MRHRAAPLATGLLCQALAAFLAGCGSGGGNSPSPPPPSPAPVPVDSTPPTVPQGLTATAQSATQIALAWTASTDAGTGIAGYRVFRDAAATPIATVTVTNYTDSALTAATSYSYTVRAFDQATPANESAASAAASATTSAAPAPPVVLETERVFPNLPNFTQPIAMLQEPGSAARWYVVQKTGQVRVFDNTANVATTRLFIDISSRLNSAPGSQTDERGLLGMAFHPNFPTDPRAYLFYTGTDASLGLVDRVSEFRTTDGGATLSAGTELELFNVDDPDTNHNGGNLVFGPDGLLYIGIGDGGGGGDTGAGHGTIGNGQLLTTLLGKMLRIDVANSTMADTYAIPPTNPFAGNARCNANGNGAANCPEIFAYGFRNPWRWSFDRATSELWLNDVGQSALEEVDKVTLGGNYGWRCFEGTNAFNATCGNNPNPIPPIAQYGRGAGQSTTGGFVYRGSAIPGLVGRYVFGDFGSGNLWHIARDVTPTLTVDSTSATATGLMIASFAQDADGELYIVHLGGTLHRVVQQ